MMVANSQGSGGENLLLMIWLVKNISSCSNGRDSNTVANGDFVHCYFHEIPRPSARIVLYNHQILLLPSAVSRLRNHNLSGKIFGFQIHRLVRAEKI